MPPYSVSEPPRSLDVAVSLSNAGMQVSMSAQGDLVSSLLLNDFIPVLQINSFISRTLMPMVATFGPWAAGYGFAHDHIQLDVHITQSQGSFQFVATSEVATHGVSITTHFAGDLAADFQHPACQLLLPKLNQKTANSVTIEPLNENAVSADAQVADPTGGNSAASEGIQITGLSGLPVNIASMGESLPEPSAGPRGRKGKAQAPDCSIVLRRSEHSTKYNGFKINQPTDVRPMISKVKPRITPSTASSVVIEELEDGEIPPPTPITVIQQVGVQQCGIPIAELTTKALLSVPVCFCSQAWRAFIFIDQLSSTLISLSFKWLC